MEKPYRRPESAVQSVAAVAGPALAAGAAHALLLAAYVALFGGDVSSLVCVNRAFAGSYPFEAVRVGFDTHGYDGQYCYLLARNPFQRLDETWVDVPAYRHARVLYPLLAWACSGGDPELLLWALPAINLAALMGMALLGAVLARHYGRNPWWGFFLPLAINAGMPALRDLTDPVGTLTVCGLLAAWLLRWRPGVLALWAVAAVFSREQNALIVLIVLLAAVTEGCRGRAGGLAGALLLGAGWAGFLRGVYGAWPFVSGNVGPPFAGLWHITAHASLIHTAGMAHLAAQILLCGALVFVKAERTTRLVALAGAALAVFGGVLIYASFDSYARVFVWMPLGIWLWSVQSGRRWPMWFLAPWALWPAVALLQAWRAIQPLAA